MRLINTISKPEYEEEKEEEMTGIRNNKLQKIVFLYYDYSTGLEYPTDKDRFFHPKDLDTDLINELEKLHWKIKFGRNGSTGYRIRIHDASL